ncbi:MAG: Fe(3+) dicitrate transport protein [Nonlabens sp.]|jgi:Fe(3+) dicitrate transport protein
MKLKVFSLLLFLTCASNLNAQIKISGQVKDAISGKIIDRAEIFNKVTTRISNANADGVYEMTVDSVGVYPVIAFAYGYQVIDTLINVQGSMTLNFNLKVLSTELAEVEIVQAREEVFNISRLRAVEGTAIYAGKKSEIILLNGLVGNLASNNARQVYAQVVGLNIYDSEAAGLQLSVGGRGLDPNRTSNFNTRQNGYDISADVLGYPESYYTPPAEALEEIQVIRGAASLQYGTQFGGLINFKMKRPNPDQPVEWVSRQNLGSFGLLTSFNSLSGTKDRLSYYTYFNYKQGDGFRPNSGFESKNFYGHLGYQISDRTKLGLEYTHLNYLAQQAGGLTDVQFNSDPTFSNRSRNWFNVDWNLFNLKLEHELNDRTDWSFNLFGLSAARNAVGFRGDVTNLNSNPVTDIDEQANDGSYINPRDLIKGSFNNWGAETRLLTRYDLGKHQSVFLIGSKFFKANNTAVQGPGTNGIDADFSLDIDAYPDYPNQSYFDFPNLNAAVFGENIFYLNDKISLTPGFRFEYIKTESAGTFNNVVLDNAGNAISNRELTDNRSLERSFFLFGLGLSYDQSDNLQMYANISQNYRSVTFSDIRTVNPSFIIDPNIQDEKGFTADFGARGSWNDVLSYDIGGFSIIYDDRIGIILDERANRLRTNIGKALILGAETFVEWNLAKTFQWDQKTIQSRWFVNIALTTSEYIDSKQNNVDGREVEFIPALNLKTGFKFGYRNLMMSLQYTYLSEQFTDAENSLVPEAGDARNGLIGQIPDYSIIDLSFSYKLGRWQVETGVNNLLNEKYFTRRATGYPGPGIIPSDPRSYYFTLAVKL